MAHEGRLAGGYVWGDDISEERQAKLKELADRQRELAKKPLVERLAQSHFGRVYLSGADVFWLAAYAQATAHAEADHLTSTSLPEELHHLASISTDWHEYFTEAKGRLRRKPRGDSDDPDGPLVLHDAVLHLEGANLERAHLEGAHFYRAHLECANLCRAQLEGADLTGAHLESADLAFADLEGASLNSAHVEDANLMGAHLGGANLNETHCEGAYLSGAYFDRGTFLNKTKLNRASLDQVTFDNTGLATVDWRSVSLVGEEVRAQRSHSTTTGEPVDPDLRLEWYLAAVRAYRLLAVVLRGQGMNEDADRFAYRAQLMQRVVLRRQAFLRADRESAWVRARLPREESKRIGWGERLRKFAAYLGSGLLDLIAGYGYRPGRSILAYIVIICAFAGLYLLNGQFASPHLRWDEALVLSISSFHGRGFFTSGVSLGDTLARLAAGEAIVGLLLEITFIATFTNRFFAR